MTTHRTYRLTLEILEDGKVIKTNVKEGDAYDVQLFEVDEEQLRLAGWDAEYREFAKNLIPLPVDMYVRILIQRMAEVGVRRLVLSDDRFVKSGDEEEVKLLGRLINLVKSKATYWRGLEELDQQPDEGAENEGTPSP